MKSECFFKFTVSVGADCRWEKYRKFLNLWCNLSLDLVSS